ncbi:phosphatidate cytidylyltransferase [Mycoplasma sp. NEAQ87857]|uniref:phosphatidate cytidylyltransferase n=1 Tax=Mycoplasma sp. NEAQ87857 TaxID=2683967 RepID=UPI00131A8FC3|nr:phosphatidate cytidylyltransferase [Mycoplasma sp. NEAQ87857]
MNFPINKKSKNSLLVSRIIPGIVLGVLAIAIIALFRLSLFTFNQQDSTLKIVLQSVSVVIFSVIVFWSGLELSKAFYRNIYLSLLSAIIFTFFIIFPSVGLENKVWFSNPDIVKTSPLTNILFNHQKWLYFIISSLFFVILFILIRMIQNQNRLMRQIINKSLILFICYIILYLFFNSFVILNAQEAGLQKIILFVLIAISHDMGGFFGGKLLGNKFIKIKLAPNISPKKTYEGAIVGVLVALIISIVFLISYNVTFFKEPTLVNQYFFLSDVANPITSNSIILAFLIMAPISALVGDLFFSFIKRVNEIKDFSKIFLGHGGLLDRLDSIAFVFVLWSMFASF